MAYNREVKSIENDLQTAWQGIRAAISQMRPSSHIRPANATDIFRPGGGSAEPKFGVGPVVFNVPEHPNGRESNLYIAISGWLCFGAPLPPDPRRTTLRFGTQVGYFRVKGEQLVHIYGVHYDMDEKLRGHPVFHGQMSSQNGGGGLHLRFVFTGGNIPAKLYEDLYYYVEGRAEVTLTFVNLTAPFSSSWASSIVKSVMARAKSIAG